MAKPVLELDESAKQMESIVIALRLASLLSILATPLILGILFYYRLQHTQPGAIHFGPDGKISKKEDRDWWFRGIKGFCWA